MGEYQKPSEGLTFLVQIWQNDALPSGDPDSKRGRAATPLAIVLSSVAFGASHGQWACGALAGLGFAGVAYWASALGPAIFAHGVANAGLAVYVLVTHHYSLWG